MRKWFSLITVLGFISMASLGFSVMAHGSDNGHSGCIAAAVQRTDCADTTGFLGMISLHAKAFGMFSSAVFWQSVLSIVSLILFAFVFLGFDLRSKLEPQYLNPNLRQADSRKHSRHKITHWLAFHQNSPTFS